MKPPFNLDAVRLAEDVFNSDKGREALKIGALLQEKNLVENFSRYAFHYKIKLDEYWNLVFSRQDVLWDVIWNDILTVKKELKPDFIQNVMRVLVLGYFVAEDGRCREFDAKIRDVEREGLVGGYGINLTDDAKNILRILFKGDIYLENTTPIREILPLSRGGKGVSDTVDWIIDTARQFRDTRTEESDPIDVQDIIASALVLYGIKE